MQPKVVEITPRKEEKERVLKGAEEFLERVKKGTTKGFLLFEEGPNDFTWTRCNMTYSDAFMGCARMSYKMNCDWDKNI